MVNKKKLRFAVLIDSHILKKWQVDCIDYLISSNYANLICIIKNKGSNNYKANKHSLGFRFLERRIRNSGPLELVNTVEKYKSIYTLEVAPIKDSRSTSFSNQDLAEIISLNLDFILRFGFGILKGDILNIPLHGIWSFHHGDPKKFRGGPPSFWEIFKNETVSGAILQQLTEKLDGGNLLKEGFLKTISHNYKDNVYQLLEESKHWPTAVVKSIVLNESFEAEPIETKAPIYKTPSNLEVVQFLFLEFLNKIKFHYRELFKADKWNIGLIEKPMQSLIDNDIKEVKWFKERSTNQYVADPFIDPENKDRIYCELFDYSSQKGTITSFNKEGDEERTIYSKKHHLSYPFTFNTEDKSYLIPESYEDNQIRLLELKDSKVIDSKQILLGKWIDPTLFYDGNYWWLFSTEKEKPNENLYLFYSKKLDNAFSPHALNPIITDIESARPAGNLFQKNGNWYRPAQNCSKTYGGSIQIKQIEKITPTEYKEVFVKDINPIKNNRYNNGIHTISSFGNQTLIDGKRLYFNFWHFLSQFRLKIKRLSSK